MAGKTIDLNAALVRKVNSLLPEAKQAYKSIFAKAPLMLSLFQFLETRPDEKFKNSEAVLHIYKIKRSHTQYLLFENRYFKLRKKCYDFFYTTSSINIEETLTVHEIQLQDAKALMINGNYSEADKQLKALEETLWRDNIFELLPDTLDQISHNNQLLRRTEESEHVYTRLKKAVELHHDLYTAKMLARQIFDTNITYGLKRATKLFLRLQRLSINRKSYPRFKIIYNLISATCKLSGGGVDFKPNYKIISRFIATLQKINALHPNMPDYNYLAGYTHVQSFRFKYLAVMNYYAVGQYKEAANIMREIYDLVMATDSPLKRMRNSFQFTAFCIGFVAAERFEEALEAANHYLHYAREVKREDELLRAYMEIANVHIWLYPAKSGYTNLFITQKIDEFVRKTSKQEHSGYYTGLGIWMKIKLLLAKGEYINAAALFTKQDFNGYFTDTTLHSIAKSTIALLADLENEVIIKKKIDEQLSRIRVHKLKTILPPDYLNFRFLERLLEREKKNLKY